MLSKKSMLYKKLFLTYTVVVVCLIGGFDFYLIHYVVSNSRIERLSLGERLGYDVNEMLNEIENSNKFIVHNMYYDSMVTKDIIYFLNNSTNDYLKNKLDIFSNSNQFTYAGIENFVANAFISNDKIENIIFISEKFQEVKSFNKFKQIYTQSIEDYEGTIKNLAHTFFYENKLFYVNKINNPETLLEEGKLIIIYNLDDINRIISNYGIKYNVLLLDEGAKTMYVPEGDYSDYSDEYLKILSNLKEGEEYQHSTITSVTKIERSDNLSIISKISMKELIEAPHLFFSSIILVDFILIAVTFFILKFKIEKLTNRTDMILTAMEEVKAGNLNVHIPIDNERDEVSYISNHFNQMCAELDKYINKSYLAEINQKKAEMIALQNQINPHFLYNTLECIRMKALCNGDKDVGKMLYNLSFLFRKQVKDKDLITLQSELEYCTRYMEIFKFRYHEKFDFKINCPEELFDNEMIKFTIQPLIENYFVHGIRLEEDNNFVEINVMKENEDIKIIIDDNGKGISEEKLAEITQNISKGVDIKMVDQSIGIINAQTRIVGTYGERYGIKLENNSIGARVIITIPCKRGLSI